MLEGVKAGDSIIVECRDSRSIAVVEKVTKFHVCCDTARYLIRNGRPAGASTWDYTRAVPSTPESLKEVRAENRHKRLVSDAIEAWRNFQLAAASDEKLQALIELLTTKGA